MNLLLVSDNSRFKEAFKHPLFSEYNVSFIENNGTFLISEIQQFIGKVDTIVVTEGMGDNTVDLISSIKQLDKTVRVIYITASVNENSLERVRQLCDLVRAGFYDILVAKNINVSEIIKVINNPMVYGDVNYLLSVEQNLLMSKSVFKNVISFNSVKPSSGKSTLATNVATAIAMFGQLKTSGEKPKVAIIEGDLNNLSIGTMLRVENERYNLSEALRMIASVVKDDGTITANEDEIKNIKAYVRRCFVSYSKIPNLYAMVTSKLTLEELSMVNPYRYYFLIECVVGAFDIVIIDTNSSLDHRTTGSILELSNRIYLLLDMDINNIENNSRYLTILRDYNILSRSKYILNKNVPFDKQTQFLEDLGYVVKNIIPQIKISNTIPLIDKNYLNESVKTGIPIVLSKEKVVGEFQDAILKIANENWKIDFAKYKAYLTGKEVLKDAPKKEVQKTVAVEEPKEESFDKSNSALFKVADTIVKLLNK